jgi:hypothetical protein
VWIRILVGLLAALRAVLVYGEASAAEAWEPRLPRLRAPSRSADRALPAGRRVQAFET